MKEVSVIGSGGHARSLIPLLLDQGFNVTGVYDTSFQDRPYEEIYKNIKLIGKECIGGQTVVLAFGDNHIRKKYLIGSLKVLESNLFHSSSFVDDTVSLGNSNVVFANSFINANASLGDNNIVNTGSLIEHEVTIGSHNHIAVNATICGRVRVGDLCFIGAGATIIDSISICDNVVVGAGATVVSDIRQAGTYVGTPARKVK